MARCTARFAAEDSAHEEVLRSAVAAVQAHERGEYTPYAVVVIYSGRNRLLRVSLPTGDYIVKCFAQLSLLRRIYYSYIGKSKAERSHRNALYLQSLDIPVSRSVGYMEEYGTWALLRRSYYVCAAIDASGYDIHPEMRGWSARTGLDAQLSEFLVQLHRHGVLHQDLSPGNILYRHDLGSGSYTFYLVDLNRVKFLQRALLPEEIASNIARLSSNPSVTRRLSYYYAKQSGANLEQTERLFRISTDKFWRKRHYKLASRWCRRYRSSSRLGFAARYALYCAARFVRKRIPLPNRWGAFIFCQEKRFYIDWLSAEDIRHVIRLHEGYGFSVPRPTLHHNTN